MFRLAPIRSATLRWATCPWAIIIGLLLAAQSPVLAQDAAAALRAKVMPVLKAHCAICHGGDKPKAGLNLAEARTLADLRSDSDHWFKVLERIEDGSMPPKDETPLTAAEREVVVGWIRGELSNMLISDQRRLGRSKLRRLNRTEYANTVYDIFGIRPPVGRDLPVDGRVDGFDKVSGALPLSSAHAEGYVNLAEVILGRMLQPSPKEPAQRTHRLWAGPSEQSKGHILELPDGTMVSFNTDTTSGPLRPKSADGRFASGRSARVPGMHRLRLSVYAYQTDKPLAFGIYAGHTGAYPQVIELLTVLEAPPGKPAVLETEVYFRTGADSDLGRFADGFRLIPFGLGVQVPKNSQASQCKGPGLAVQWVDVEEPEWPLAGDRWITADMPPHVHEVFTNSRMTAKNTPVPRRQLEAVARETLERVGARLFRRDLTRAEVTAIMTRFNRNIDGGAPFRTALLEELSALLTAPDFLCIIEQPGRLNGFALASRLSFFLWNAAPDEELLDLARKGRLTDPRVLREQTERLLKDPRSQRFVKDFTDQWLGLWGIDHTTPDKDLYPEYDEVLKISSVMETQATFARILAENRSVRDFIAPDWALVNERLAQHYNLPPVAGFALREVKVPADSRFGGIWTQSAVMKVTANGTLTSPVKRGVWVAERLLGITIPPPPANIEPVNPDTRGAKTLREQLALHSGQGSCQACHVKFDPYGFALESFDVTGAFREKYREVNPGNARQRWRDGLPVDTTGITPDGVKFAGIAELRRELVKNPGQLAFGVTRHLITYATGTPAGPLDRGVIEQIVSQAAMDDHGLRSLIHGVVQSELFRMK